MDRLVADIFEKLAAREWMIAAAESCTGGLIAARLTSVAGSSAYVDRGFVTYSNQAKMEMLNVPPALIDDHGAVSPEVAQAMAKGALDASRAGIAVSVTGIAGPGGGSDDKPVGTVHIGIATWDHVESFHHVLQGGRDEVRAQTVALALGYVLKAVS